LSKLASLNGPPKYCDSECYTDRLTPVTGKSTKSNFRSVVDFKIAMESVRLPERQEEGDEDPRLDDPYAIPVRRNGLPWINVEKIIPDNRLHIRSQHTLNFWDHILTLSDYLNDLSPLEYNAFLFEFVCRRGSPHMDHAELQPCWSLWPYIEPSLDDRYSPMLLESFCQNYLYTERAYFKRSSVMSSRRLYSLIMQCFGAWQQFSTGPADERTMKFAELWLRPLLQNEAPYKRTDPNKADTHLAHYSRIQTELERHTKAVSEMWEDSTRLAVLKPLTTDQYQGLMDLYVQIMEFYTEALFTKYNPPTIVHKTGHWPWGANCYAALVADHRASLIEEVKLEMRTTPKYNLPEPY